MEEFTPYKFFEIWDKVPKTLELLKRFDIWPVTFGYVTPEAPNINGISTIPASNYMAFKSDASWTQTAGEANSVVTMGLRFGYPEKPTTTIPNKQLYLGIGGMQKHTRYIGGFIAAIYPVPVTDWPFADDTARDGRNSTSSTLIISE